MKIEVRLFASLARYMPAPGAAGSPEQMEVAEGLTVNELLRRMKVPQEAVKVVFLNGLHATGDQVLRQGDRVGVFPPVAGG
ncbi:MAG: MoaD/ThiS family protein [Deltaproteobacteria bacterium]|nr:MoaD/ThiS family protein [Deltaproteobacteria bacterium]